MDNSPVLWRINSKTAGLIYFDPPFNSGRQWEKTIGEGNKHALTPLDSWTLSDTRANEETLPATNCPRVKNVINIKVGSWSQR